MGKTPLEMIEAQDVKDAAKKAAAERALIHEHAFQFVLASFHNGTPRMKAWTALRLSATLAEISKSPEMERFKTEAIKQSAQTLDEVTKAVRQDEEQRQKDDIYVTTQEAAVLDRSFHAASVSGDDGAD